MKKMNVVDTGKTPTALARKVACVRDSSGKRRLKITFNQFEVQT